MTVFENSKPHLRTRVPALAGLELRPEALAAIHPFTGAGGMPALGGRSCAAGRGAVAVESEVARDGR